MRCEQKKKYLKYTFALSAAVKIHKKYREVQVPYYCKCGYFHLTMKRVTPDREKELKERIVYLKTR